MNNPLHKKDKVFYARIIPNCGIYEVAELTVRTVESDWFVGIEKRDNKAYLLSYSKIGEIVFLNREECLRKVQKAEASSLKISSETFYEEF